MCVCLSLLSDRRTIGVHINAHALLSHRMRRLFYTRHVRRPMRACVRACVVVVVVVVVFAAEPNVLYILCVRACGAAKRTRAHAAHKFPRTSAWALIPKPGRAHRPRTHRGHILHMHMCSPAASNRPPPRPPNAAVPTRNRRHFHFGVSSANGL